MMRTIVDTNHIPERLMQMSHEVHADVAKAVYRTGARFRTKVRAGASGRPGPRVQTGNYRRSIAQTNTQDAQGPVALIHTNAPQALRLEYGFVGVDAAGRHFNQPPYPHWRPAMQGIAQDLADEMASAVNHAINGIWRRP